MTTTPDTPQPAASARAIERIKDDHRALARVMGAMRILELREKARAALGPRFDIRRFHDWVLGSGSLPMTTLERHVQAFIDASNL